jgi:hypothetical protein
MCLFIVMHYFALLMLYQSPFNPGSLVYIIYGEFGDQFARKCTVTGKCNTNVPAIELFIDRTGVNCWMEVHR